MHAYHNIINRWQFWGGLSVVIAFLHSPRLQHPQESNHRPFLFALITVQYPATNIEYTLYKVFICSVGRVSFASSKFLAAASRDSKTVLYTLYILPLVPLSLLIGAFQGEAETLETFQSLSGALLLASVASMTWILERRFLRHGKSPLTLDILRGAYYQRKSVQI